MRSFRDVEGTTWEVRGTLSAFERVKTTTGVDLLDVATTQKSLQQLSDPFTLGHVLYQLCAQQAESRGISPEQFADRFNGDTLHDASTAVLEEVVFFCRSGMRPALQMALEKARMAEQRMMEAMHLRMADIEREMDAALASTDFATNSQESSDATQENGRSAASSGRPGRRKRNAGAACPR